MNLLDFAWLPGNRPFALGGALRASRSSRGGSAPFRKDYPLIVGSSTEKGRLLSASVRGTRGGVSRASQRISRFCAQPAAVAQQISCDVSVIALRAVKCVGIGAGESPANTQQMHPCMGRRQAVTFITPSVASSASFSCLRRGEVVLLF